MTSTLTNAPARPPLVEAMRSLVDCHACDRPVPKQLLESVRAWQLTTLADAIERYNARVSAVDLLADAS